MRVRAVGFVSLALFLGFAAPALSWPVFPPPEPEATPVPVPAASPTPEGSVLAPSPTPPALVTSSGAVPAMSASSAGTATSTGATCAPAARCARDVVFPAGTLGLSLGLPAGGAPTAGVSLFVLPRMAVRADVGLASETNPKTTTDFSVELGVRQYLRRAGPIRAFVQPSVFASHVAGTNVNTLAATAGFGLECFFLDRVSVSGSTGIAYVNVDRPRSGQVSTGTSALFGNFYW